MTTTEWIGVLWAIVIAIAAWSVGAILGSVIP